MQDTDQDTDALLTPSAHGNPDPQHRPDQGPAIKTVDEEGKARQRAEKEARKAAEREEAERKRKELVPEPENMRPINFGVSLVDGNRKRDEPIDMGGHFRLEEAQEKGLEFGEQVDVDWEVFEQISGPLEFFYTKRMEAQAAGKADFEDIAKLSPAAQAALADYEQWRFRAKKIKELRTSKDKEKRELGRQGRIFSSGLEFQRALLFLEQTEIVATHALGYELTNGGREKCSFRLTSQEIDFPERGNMPNELRQAVHQIAEAFHISDPNERATTVKSLLVASSAGVAAGGAGLEVAKIITVLTASPAIGAAVGAGAGIVVLGSEVLIGNWILSFPPSKEEGVAFTLRFRANPPAGSPQTRIVDSPMGRHFLGRGESHHHYTSDFIKKSEMTRHAIYRRLGLRVEKYGPFNWSNINSTQERFIRRLGIRKPLLRGWSALDTRTKAYIEELGSGKDLWMIDLNPTNLSISSTDTASFHGKLRQHIQYILSEQDRNLPSQRLSSGDIYYDFSNLSPEERHEIMVKAYDRMAADICSNAGGRVLQRIMLREEGRADALAQLTAAEGEIKTGTKVVQVGEFTPEVIGAEQGRRAQALDKITVIKSQGESISTIDGEIKAQEQQLQTEIGNYTSRRNEHGSLGDPAAVPPRGPDGKIGQYRQKIDTEIQPEIDRTNGELGEGRLDPVTNTYPPDTVLGKYYGLKAEMDQLTSELDIITSEFAALQNIRGADPARLTYLSGEARRIKGQLKIKQEQFSSVERYKATLEEQRRTKIDERNTLENNIRESLRIVQEAADKRDAVDRQLTDLRNRRNAAIAEIRRLIEFKGDYGTELYNTLLAQANAEVKKIEKELKEKDIPFEAGGEEIKIVSAVDKKRAEGMQAIHQVGNELSNIQDRMWKDYDAEGLSDSQRCYEVLLRIIFGKEALSPDKRAFYERLLSKSAVVEELIEKLRVEGRETQFFHGDSQGRQAFETSRRNAEQMQTLSVQIQELRTGQITGWENQVKILEGRRHHFQDENVRLLDGLFNRYVPSFLGHSRFTDGEFVRILVDRMIENGNNFQPFTDTVQYGERIIPHIGLDGTVTIRPPDINPTDDTLINNGGIAWTSPETYRIAGQSVRLRIETPISRTGRPVVNVELQVQNLRSLYAVLPPALIQLPPGSAIAGELTRLGLLNQLYDAAGNRISNRTRVFRDLANDENINKQISEAVWQLSARGINNANNLEAWLRGGANYNFGGRETDQFYRSLVRAFAESTPEANAEIVRRFNSVRQGNFGVMNERGELRLYRYDAAGTVETTISLHELLYTLDETQRRKIISRRDLNGILYGVGKNLFESARLRRR